MKKQLRYLLYLILVTIFIVEFSPYIISPILLGKSFSRNNLKKELLQAQAEIAAPEQSDTSLQGFEYLSDHVLHPYMGFVSVLHETYNRFGFPGTEPILKKSEDTINICLMGGSVAKGLFQTSRERLIDNLRASKLFAGKEINIISMALGGFKQPQQLMALNYFLALGAHYDIVINLDGFNEIVLPYCENLPYGVFPSYPRLWNIYSRKKLDSKVELVLSKQIGLKEELANMHRFFISNYLYNSNFGLLTWNILSNKKRLALFQLDEKLRLAVSNSGSDFQSTGPKEEMVDTLQFFDNQANFWKQASMLIADICRPKGYQYFHFLQPNQYVAGSKQLTAEELQIAYETGPYPYKEAVQKGYPFLVKYGKDLTAQHIHFTDLTLLFQQETRSVYNDKCCHFNELGNGLIADEIARIIVQSNWGL